MLLYLTFPLFIFTGNNIPDVNEEEYNVERILAQRFSNGVTEYLVRWKDYDPIYDSWEREHDIVEKQVLRDYLEIEQRNKQSAANITCSSESNGDVALDITVNKNAAEGVCPNGHSSENKPQLSFDLEHGGVKQTVFVSLRL
mgnify:CR=1 FL=1